MSFCLSQLPVNEVTFLMKLKEFLLEGIYSSFLGLGAVTP